MAESVHVTARINEEEIDFWCEPNQSLLECLREVVGLRSPKIGCTDGNCGACSVLLDGRLVNSCLVLGAEIDGHEVLTVEGLAGWPGLHPIQQAFVEEGALQCGYCTPGMIMAVKALIEVNPAPSDRQIREWITGNLCRCTGYDTIVRAVHAAASSLANESQGGGSE